MGNCVAARSGFIERWLAGRSAEERVRADEELRLLIHWHVLYLTGRWDIVGNELPADGFHLDAGKATPEQVDAWRTEQTERAGRAP